ncbi:unnamed protein product [Penicillium salamii]|uniref:Uncharacterized protein n=1 Tax=Penicillium salamii TaxID=1612424 RepID=A0A9W4N220_9EURO|nr:unnamed protein product [Penicillium salamii]
MALDYFALEWPTRLSSRLASPEVVNLEDYLNLRKIITRVIERFNIWRDNGHLRQCLNSMVAQLYEHLVICIQLPSFPWLAHP